jgi:hypothetical protein
MAREHANVVLGGLTIGFAFVEADAAGQAVSLVSPWLLAHPRAAAHEEAHSQCPCRTEELAFAQVRSRRGGSWSLGVKVCPRHMHLRLA